jgi:hypothetical protein
VGAPYANPDGKLETGKSYVVFGKSNSRAINLSAIADASNIRFTWIIVICLIGTHNQIIQAIAVDIACAGD